MMMLCKKRFLGAGFGLCLIGALGCGEKGNSQAGAKGSTTGAASASASSNTSQKPKQEGGEKAKPGSLELGEHCKEDAACKSGICIVGLDLEGEKDTDEAKTCASCRDDAQCIKEKKGLVCARGHKDGIIKCADGKLGTQCSKNEHCAKGLMCSLINLGENKSWEKTCSECGKHTDCPAEGKRNCVSRDTPDGPGLFNLCLPDKVRKSGEICFPCETGNRECADGFCVKVKIKDEGIEGFDKLCLGVCGACATDADCPADSRCTPPELDYTKDPKKDGVAIHKSSRCVKKG